MNQRLKILGFSVLCVVKSGSFSKCSLVFEEASKAEGHKLEDRLQNKNEGEDVVTDLQCLVQLLWMSGRKITL